jgi:hypothetical protein
MKTMEQVHEIIYDTMLEHMIEYQYDAVVHIQSKIIVMTLNKPFTLEQKHLLQGQFPEFDLQLLYDPNQGHSDMRRAGGWE